MENQNMSFMAVMLVVGLLIGGGVGWFMKPAEDEIVTTETPSTTPPVIQEKVIYVHTNTVVTWVSLLLGVLNLVAIAITWKIIFYTRLSEVK